MHILGQIFMGHLLEQNLVQLEISGKYTGETHVLCLEKKSCDLIEWDLCAHGSQTTKQTVTLTVFATWKYLSFLMECEKKKDINLSDLCIYRKKLQKRENFPI